MKRHQSIVILSREHHVGLLFCWKIRQGIKAQVSTERMQPYVEYFWEKHLLPHFGEEETVLFASLRDSLVEQAISEHKQIRQLVEAVMYSKNIQPEQLRALADALDNHIRFEERVLFPHIEKMLSEDMLAELGNRLRQLHQEQEPDEYGDEFWVKHSDE